MRRTVTIVSILLAAIVLLGAAPRRKQRKAILAYITPLEYRCSAVGTDGWKSSGGAALNIEIDYWAEGNCTAQVAAKPPAGAPLVVGPPHGVGPMPDPVNFAGVASADFYCGGTGGKCYFRVRQVTAPGVTNTASIAKPTEGWPCQSGETSTILDQAVPSDVLVRVTAPANCTASVSADGGTPVTVTGTQKFVSFSRARTIKATCTGSGSGRCKFEVRAWW